jgi:uridylate kinase
MEINGELLIKATKVNGIYSEDPRKNPHAQFYHRITFQEAHDRRLGVMDATAFTLCMDNHIPLIVLNFWEPGALRKAVQGETVGTFIDNGVA